MTAFDADEANGTKFLVMQYVEGTDLAALVRDKGLLSVERAPPCSRSCLLSITGLIDLALAALVPRIRRCGSEGRG